VRGVSQKESASAHLPSSQATHLLQQQLLARLHVPEPPRLVVGRRPDGPAEGVEGHPGEAGRVARQGHALPHARLERRRRGCACTAVHGCVQRLFRPRPPHGHPPQLRRPVCRPRTQKARLPRPRLPRETDHPLLVALQRGTRRARLGVPHAHDAAPAPRRHERAAAKRAQGARRQGTLVGNLRERRPHAAHEPVQPGGPPVLLGHARRVGLHGPLRLEARRCPREAEGRDVGPRCHELGEGGGVEDLLLRRGGGGGGGGGLSGSGGRRGRRGGRAGQARGRRDHGRGTPGGGGGGGRDSREPLARNGALEVELAEDELESVPALRVALPEERDGVAELAQLPLHLLGVRRGGGEAGPALRLDGQHRPRVALLRLGAGASEVHQLPGLRAAGDVDVARRDARGDGGGSCCLHRVRARKGWWTLSAGCG
jgi:hypothetical protein